MSNEATTTPAPPTEAKESRLIVRSGFDLARELEIGKVLVLAELLTDRRIVERHRKEETVIWITVDEESFRNTETWKVGDDCIEIPATQVDRVGRMTLALILAVMKGVIQQGESVICLTGLTGSKRLDNLLIANPQRDFPWFSQHTDSTGSELLTSREFVRLFEIALKFAAEGREGKPIGTMFVLGDVKELAKRSRPLIINPCKGHVRRMRNIHDNAFIESLREFAALDGGFIVDRKGVVEQAGVYFDAPITKKVHVDKGLGSRHLAAAAITARTHSIAIVISESSGTVTVFFHGSKLMSVGRR